MITAASLRLYPAPGEVATAWLGVPSPAAALELLAVLRGALGGTISAFELIHGQGLAFLTETLPGVPVPPATGTEWVVLAEVADCAGAAPERASRRRWRGRSKAGSRPTR